MKWWVSLVIILIVIILIDERVKRRGFFWKMRGGEEITSKEFLKRWRDGLEGVTPFQQTKIALWSYVPLLAGILWGLAITFIGGVYWMALILFATLPITLVQVLSTWQKYRRLKLIEEVMKKEVNKE